MTAPISCHFHSPWGAYKIMRSEWTWWTHLIIFKLFLPFLFFAHPCQHVKAGSHLWFCVGYTEITLEKIETHTKSENSSIIDIYSWSFCVCTDLYTPAMCFISVAIFRFSCNIIGNIEKGISLLDIGRFFYFPKSEYCQDFIQGIYSLFVFTQMKTMKPM